MRGVRFRAEAVFLGGRAQQTIHPFLEPYKAGGVSRGSTRSSHRMLPCTHDVDGVMQEVSVLILVRDILGAGLLAALVDSTGRTPVFPVPGERAESAVERLRPSWILVECHHQAARSDGFYTAVAGAGARVIVFAPGPPWADCEELARRHDVAAFIHGNNSRSLADLVRRALSE